MLKFDFRDEYLDFFSQAMESANSSKLLDTMKEELKSIDHNNVWDIVELLEGCKWIGCKYVYKTKCDSNGNVGRYKAKLIAKGFAQKNGIDYNKIFSSVFENDSFGIIMALMNHYD